MDLLVIDDDYDIQTIKDYELKNNTQIIFVLDMEEKTFIQKLRKSLQNNSSIFLRNPIRLGI